MYHIILQQKISKSETFKNPNQNPIKILAEQMINFLKPTKTQIHTTTKKAILQCQYKKNL